MKAVTSYGSMRFLRFCGAGLAGFVTDTAVLLALVRFGHVNPSVAKALSFLVAVLLTFELNRRWTFDQGRNERLAPLASYLAVQCVGFLCNWIAFTLAVSLLPQSIVSVLVAAIFASAAALAFNFIGAENFVFDRKS